MKVFPLASVLIVAALTLLATVTCNPGATQTSLPQSGLLAPSDVAAIAGDSRVHVTWSIAPGATSYFVYYALGTTVAKGDNRAPATDTSCDVTGLTNGAQYAFAVTSFDGTNESGLSAVATATPNAPPTPPVAPAISSATPGDGSVILTWDGVGGAASYNLYYAQGITVDKNGTKVADAASPETVSGLASGTQYAFALTAVNGVGEGGLSAVVTATPTTAVDPGDTVMDVDGNVYHTVTIGTQVWMAENLKVTKYRDGSAIPCVTDRSAWAALTTPAYCFYNNDSVGNKATYGALYNWYAVSPLDAKRIAPAGWHVPTDADWTTLTTFLGGESSAGGKLKEAGTAHWLSPNAGATNSSGFTAFPGGCRSENGAFVNIGAVGIWWTEWANIAGFSWIRTMYSPYTRVDHSYGKKQLGVSVRCVRDTKPPLTPPAATECFTTSGNGLVNVSWVYVAGAVSYNLYYTAGSTVDRSGTKISDATSPQMVSGLTNGTQYAFAVSAVNDVGEGCLSPAVTATPTAATAAHDTVMDVEGNVYHYVTIGTQVWMVENLKTTKYRDGSPIRHVTDGAAWAALTTPAYCWYINDSVGNKATYGALYNWAAVYTGKLAPAGWHVPTDAEWTTLTTYLGGDSIAGGKLKEASTEFWAAPNSGATNSSGFTALPGGYRISSGEFYCVGLYGYWWSATRVGDSDAWGRHVRFNGAEVGRHYNAMHYGRSIRCVRDEPTPGAPPAPVISSAKAGNGSVTVSWGYVGGATSYNLYYRAGTTVDKSTGTKITNVSSPETLYGLTNGTQYACAVSAVSVSGEGELSAVATATPHQ